MIKTKSITKLLLALVMAFALICVGALMTACGEDSSNNEGDKAPAVQTINITYDLNGGTGTAPEVDTIEKGVATEVEMPSLTTRRFYTFAGWSTSQDATTAEYTAGSEANLTLTANTTLYAIWTGTPETITDSETITEIIAAADVAMENTMDQTKGAWSTITINWNVDSDTEQYVYDTDMASFKTRSKSNEEGTWCEFVSMSRQSMLEHHDELRIPSYWTNMFNEWEGAEVTYKLTENSIIVNMIMEDSETHEVIADYTFEWVIETINGSNYYVKSINIIMNEGDQYIYTVSVESVTPTSAGTAEAFGLSFGE